MDKHKNNENYFQLDPHRHTGSCRTDETETSGDLSCLPAASNRQTLSHNIVHRPLSATSVVIGTDMHRFL